MRSMGFYASICGTFLLVVAGCGRHEKIRTGSVTTSGGYAGEYGFTCTDMTYQLPDDQAARLRSDVTGGSIERSWTWADAPCPHAFAHEGLATERRRGCRTLNLPLADEPSLKLLGETAWCYEMTVPAAPGRCLVDLPEYNHDGTVNTAGMPLFAEFEKSCAANGGFVVD